MTLHDERILDVLLNNDDLTAKEIYKELTDQDTRILRALTEQNDVSTHELYKQISVSRTQIQYRLDKLKKTGIVRETSEGRYRNYGVHPVLKDTKCLCEIAEHVKGILEIIQDKEPVEPAGLKAIIDFVMASVEIE